MSSLKLERIAPLFGYNSAYLGKLFTQKMGMNFTAYLDRYELMHPWSFSGTAP